MAYRIVVTTVDGVTFRSCELTGDDQETAAVGVAEATVAAAAEGNTTVASPTTTSNPGPSRAGIDYRPLGRLDRDAVDGSVWHRREMIAQRGGRVSREDYDEKVPTRGRGTHIPARRSSTRGGF